MFRFLIILALLIVAGCSDDKPAHTVEWYLAHPEERIARAKECNLLGLQAETNKDCLAAREASKEAMMEGFGER